MSDFSSSDTSFEAQYKRILDVTGCATQLELAGALEIRQSSISDAKRRKNIPSDWLIKLIERQRINPEWIRTGTGSQYIYLADHAQDPPYIIRVTEVRPPAKCSAQELFNELVRRALLDPNLEKIKKEAADSWRPVYRAEDNS